MNAIRVAFSINLALTMAVSAADEEAEPANPEPVVAEADFASWKATGKLPEEFVKHAIEDERVDLVERVLVGDRLRETELKPPADTRTLTVTIQALEPAAVAMTENQSEHSTVWRRITKNRFEIWTPKTGKLFDQHGKQVAEAKVRRSDGHGREWYGAFLPDGRWVTTDIDDLDKQLTMFSAKGKRQWSVKGANLIPDGEAKTPESIPLIGWARSDQTGAAWIVSVGSDRGRGWVKVTPDGKWTKVDSPWRECLPQQLGPRGMYVEKSVQSDDGKLAITRNEAGHGMFVGMPTYVFPGDVGVVVPSGERFGILPDAWAAFIEKNDYLDETAPREERLKERVWFFDTKGLYQSWIAGRTICTSAKSGGLWVRLVDDDCVKVDKGFKPTGRLRFVTKEKKPLIPVELHDDIGLGLFLSGGKLALGTWREN